MLKHDASKAAYDWTHCYSAVLLNLKLLRSEQYPWRAHCWEERGQTAFSSKLVYERLMEGDAVAMENAYRQVLRCINRHDAVER